MTEQENRAFWGSFQGSVTASMFEIGWYKSRRNYVAGCDCLRTLIQLQSFNIQEQLKDHTKNLDKIYRHARKIANPLTIHDDRENLSLIHI